MRRRIWRTLLALATAAQSAAGCDGTEETACPDLDGDGFGSEATPGCLFVGVDCDDGDPSLNPGAAEVCGDAVDQDCDGFDPSCPTETHRACSEPAPFPAPRPPDVPIDATGRPLFDLWRDHEYNCHPDLLGFLVCDGPEDPMCSQHCLPVEPSGRGLCLSAVPDIVCGDDGEVMGYRYDACFACLSSEWHAIACCAELQGVDCRAWPFEQGGDVGAVCADHEDCEPGLLCGATAGSGFGTCQCPEQLGSLPEPPGFCFGAESG